ncbi:hypothetical protein BLNAU_21523 [Blattamonas nauphoetae]|uniref:Uncharacterized protein n=1 Tax=Blattamonas nauphoetae TaxID=2049346 RepID=A0ABQ9WVN6_9EUKA|nr:hypothetical protein BLNAU_21523 [Blattamonas nauphoetae]
MASTLVQHTLMDSCVLQNVTHINRYGRSCGVKEPFNVSLTNSVWIDCSNGFYGSIVRDVEDQTTFRAVNNTFLRGVTNGETTGGYFYTTQIVDSDHTYISCTFTSCAAFDSAGGAIRCRGIASLTVIKCEFYYNKCNASAYDDNKIKAVGGAIHFHGESIGALRINASRFDHNTANLGGAVSTQFAISFNFQLSNITNGSCFRFTKPQTSFGGGLMVAYLPYNSIVSNLRFDGCNSEGSGGAIDCSNMTGSITFSNLFIANSQTRRGNVVFSDVQDPSSKIQFFSCIFFNNNSTQQNAESKFYPNDIRLGRVEPWISLLQSSSTFVNCFSSSKAPKIAMADGSNLIYTFEYSSASDTRLLDIHLPSPAVIVNGQTGSDTSTCGTDYGNKCRTIAHAGMNRVDSSGGKVLIEVGRFTETVAFDLGSKHMTFTSFGDIHPIISYSGGSTAFITAGAGLVRFEYLSFVPSSSSNVIHQYANGGLEIADCSFIASDAASVEIEVSAVKLTDGYIQLTRVSFVGLRLKGGSCVECVGSITGLNISQSEFVSIGGTSPAMIVYQRSNNLAGRVTLNGTRMIAGRGEKVGGILVSNANTVTLTDVKMSNLESDEQEAAIDISGCPSLTLSSLLFERCIGKSASDIFVTSSTWSYYYSPLSQSFSTSSYPTSSINGVASDSWLTRTPLAVDGVSGSDEEFCWKNVGCRTISSLVSRIGHGVEWNTTLKQQTVGDSAISISDNLQLTVKGSSQTGTNLSHNGLVSSPILSVTSGSLSISQLTLSTSNSYTTRTSSFFVMTGGSISLTSVTFPSLSFSNSGSMLQVSGTGSLTVSSVTFSGCSTDGVGSVLHSTSSGSISLNTVSLSGNKCGSGKKGRSIAIESTTPFVSSSVVMTNVQITSEDSSGDHEVFLKGPSLPLTVTSSNFGSTLGSQAQQTVVKMKQFFGEDTSDGSMSGPLSYLLYRHSTGPVSVDASFWDHGFCGLSALPCKSLEMAHSKVNEADQIVDFVSDMKMTGTIVSKSSGSIIKSSSGKKMTAETTSQFEIGTGKLRLESMTLELPSVLSQALFVVSGGTLDVKSTVTLTNPTTTSHTSSLLSVNGGTVALDGTKLTTTQKLTLALSPLIVQTKGSLTISSLKFENITRESGDGSVIKAGLTLDTDSLSIVSTTFKLCSCSAGNGGALFVSLSASALFSITGASSFTSCTASGKGSNLYLSRPSLVSFMSTGNLDSIKPTLSIKAAADGILNEFYGFESSSSDGSLLFNWYPFSTDDTTMHVHSSGHAHSLCGKEALPCKTLPDSLSKIQSASTLMIDSNIDLSSKLTSLPSEWTLSSSGSFKVTVTSEGQIEVKDDQSNLTVSSLSLDVGTLTSERKTELVSVSAGLLVLSSCTVFSSTSNLPVSFVALSGGDISMTSTTLNIPTIRSKPVISITGGKLEVDSSTSLVNLDTVTHEASRVSIGGGEVVLDGTSLTTSKSMTFTSSALIVQTKGSLTISSMKFENITRQAGDGSVVSATLATNLDELSIISTTFKSCSCSAGNGGALFIDLSASASTSILFSSLTFGSGSDSNTAILGTNVFVRSSDLNRDCAGVLIGLKPTLSDSLLTTAEKIEYFGSETSPESLLFFWYPHIASSGAVHVHSSGEDHLNCGLFELACQTLSHSFTSLKTTRTITLDSSLSLPSSLPALTSSLTLNSVVPGSPQTLSAGSGVCFTVSSGTLKLESIILTLPVLSTSLFNIEGGIAEFDSTCTLVNPSTTHSSSLFSLSSGTLELDTTSLDFSNRFVSSQSLFSQTGGSLAFSGMSIENVTRSSGDGMSFLKGNSPTGPLAAIRPTTASGVAFSSEVHEQFWGSDTKAGSLSSGSLLFYWYPHTSGTVRVAQTGTNHIHCGEAELPCSSLSFGHDRLKESGKEVILSSAASLSASLKPIFAAETITSLSTAQTVTLSSEGQIKTDTANTQLTLKTLVFALDTSQARTSSVFSMSAGCLIVSGCTFGSSASTTSLTSSIVSVSGGTFQMIDNTVIQNMSSAHPILSLVGGTTNLVSATVRSIALTSCSAIVVNDGNLGVEDSSFSLISNSEGDGSVLRAVVSTGQTVSIVSGTISDCWTKGNGGAVHVTLVGTGRLEMKGTSGIEFERCSAVVDSSKAVNSTGLGQCVFISAEVTSKLVLDSISFPTVSDTNPAPFLFVSSPSLNSVVTTTSFAFLSPFEFSTDDLALYSGHDGGIQSVTHPLITFLLDLSKSYVGAAGNDSLACGVSLVPCETVTRATERLVSEGSAKMEIIIVDSGILNSTLAIDGMSLLVTSADKKVVKVDGGLFDVSTKATDASSLTVRNLELCWNGKGSQLLELSKGTSKMAACSLSMVASSGELFSCALVKVGGGVLVIEDLTFSGEDNWIGTFVLTSGGSTTLDGVSISNGKLLSSPISGTGSVTLVSSSMKSLDGSESTDVSALRHSLSTGVSLSIGGEGKPVSFVSCSSKGNGGALNIALLSSGTLKISHTSFTSCSSSGNGGALAVSLSASALFSITGASSFTSCTASGKGSKLYLSRPDLLSFVSAGNLDSIKPTLTTKAAADSILNEFYGFESSSSEGSLLLYWYPFSTLDTTMHVHSSGHAHSLCGKEALPCKTLPDSLSKIQSASTLMIDSNIDLSSKMTSLPRAWTLTKSGSSALTIVAAGQLEVSNSGSALTLSSLSLEVGTLTVDRTAELITISAGSLVVSSCTVFTSTPSLSVSFVSLSNGKVSFPGSTMTIPTLTSKPFVSVSGGTMNVDSSTTLVNSDTAAHQASLVSVNGGTVFLDGASLTTSKSMTFASSSMIVQTKGSLTLKDKVVENITHQTGDGSVISATLSTNTDILSIVSTAFASCSSSAGNGGALAITITSGSLSLNKCQFESCWSGMDGGAVWLDLSKMPAPSQYSLLQTTFGTGSSANEASGKGDCVFVEGEDLRRVIVGSIWRGSFEKAGEDDLWGRDKTTSTSGMSLLGLLQSQVIGVGEGGSDEAAGTMDAPFETLRRCFVETKLSDGSFAVVVVERTRMGESCWLVDQPGWTMSVSGGGGGSGSGGSSQSEVLCRVTDEEKQPGTASSSPPHAMVTLSGQTLSFFDILFSSFSAPRSMGFVFSLLVSSHLTLSSCSLSSSSPVAVSLVSVSGSSSFSADNLSIRDVSFVGKAGLMKFVEASRIGLTSCSFSSISLEGGALMWGTTRGGMAVTNTEFSKCNGKEFGSVIRIQIVGITASITNSHFTLCSTEVRMGEKGERDVVGGGCVVVEMMKRTSSTRHLPSSCVDFSLSSFTDCTLTNTDTSSYPSSLSSFVGGSGFLIFGNENSDCVILQKMKLSRCLCAGFGKMNGFDGGIVVGRRHAIFADRRDSTSSFTSFTASGKGSKLYLSQPSRVSFLTPNEETGPLDSIKPTLPTEAAADSILNEFYGFESPSSEGSLLLYWYPFSSDDTTMHVHSTGHAHSLCGKEALPCKTLPNSLSNIQSADTLMIDTNIDLSLKLTSIPRAWALTKSGSSILPTMILNQPQ